MRNKLDSKDWGIPWSLPLRNEVSNLIVSLKSDFGQFQQDRVKIRESQHGILASVSLFLRFLFHLFLLVRPYIGFQFLRHTFFTSTGSDIHVRALSEFRSVFSCFDECIWDSVFRVAWRGSSTTKGQ